MDMVYQINEKKKKNKEFILLDNIFFYSDRFILLLKLLCDKYK